MSCHDIIQTHQLTMDHYNFNIGVEVFVSAVSQNGNVTNGAASILGWKKVDEFTAHGCCTLEPRLFLLIRIMLKLYDKHTSLITGPTLSLQVLVSDWLAGVDSF